MARAVQLPRPLPTREREQTPARDPELVPDSVLRALVKELEEPVTERERKPVRDPAPRPMPAPHPERARYRYD
jgi:hypothetical protein